MHDYATKVDMHVNEVKIAPTGDFNAQKCDANKYNGLIKDQTFIFYSLLKSVLHDRLCDLL